MRRSAGNAGPSPGELPWLVRRLTGPWHRRHPRAFIAIELLVAMWLLTLGAILTADGYWEAAFLFLFAAFLLVFLWSFARALHL